MRRSPRRALHAAILGLLLSCGGGRSSMPAEPPFDIAGEVQIAFASAADGDVNDPQAVYDPNDSPADAQPLPNPVTLGGYVNAPGAGAVGRSKPPPEPPPGPPPPNQRNGDPLDYYRVSLAAGQTVRLFMATSNANNDLDLALLDADGDEVDFSDTDTPSEAVVAPASGEYVIEVSAFVGASSYVLSIGQATNPAVMTADFVPGEVIVRYREAGAGARRAADLAAELGLERAGGGSRGAQLFAGRDSARLEAALRASGAGHLAERRRDTPRQVAAALRGRPARADAALRRDTRRLAKALRRRADVLSADLNYVRHASAVPTDTYYALQWHYPLIQLQEAWDLVVPASPVVVAVIDTGVVSTHPDLQDALVAGYDFIQDPARSRDGDGCDADANDPGDSSTPGASSFHGTHVTGTLVARASLDPDADAEGVAGVAWNARVMPLRVLGRGGGTDFDLIQALYYAAGLANACGALPAAPADVINLSLGGADPSAALDTAIADVRAAGLVVVAAAGNEGSSQPSYPAASPGVISVSAVDAALRLAPYSNFGATIDVAAPGGDLSTDRTFDGYADGVLSTLYDDVHADFVYAFYQGTSMAAPHVAGVIALMLSVNDTLTPGDIDILLANGSMTRDIGPASSFGMGLIDAFEAVGAAIAAEGGAPPTLPPRLSADPGALNFGVAGTQANVALANTGGAVPPLVVSSFEALPDDGGSWLSVAAVSADANGLGGYRISVSRAGLADGIYTGVARFHSNAGDLDVPVILQVGNAVAADADAGHHYILLVHPVTGDTLDYVEAEPENGRYRFRFVDVPPGEYLIYAGTDLDNDFFICDRGEACGSYPTVDQPLPVDVQDDLSHLDFVSGFGLRLGAAAAQAADSGLARPGAPR
jgi:serine protease